MEFILSFQGFFFELEWQIVTARVRSTTGSYIFSLSVHRRGYLRQCQDRVPCPRPGRGPTRTGYPALQDTEDFFLVFILYLVA